MTFIFHLLTAGRTTASLPSLAFVSLPDDHDHDYHDLDVYLDDYHDVYHDDDDNDDNQDDDHYEYRCTSSATLLPLSLPGER